MHRKELPFLASPLIRACSSLTMSSVSLIASPTVQYLLQSLVGSTYSRRLLLHRHPREAAAASPDLPPDSSLPPSSSFSAKNAVMVLAVLLIAVTCALALDSIARCALRCSGLLGSLIADGDVAAPADHAGAPKARAPMKKASTLPTLAYSSGLRLAGAECVICLSEFAVGERLRVLPGCEHGFHAQCIDRWLRSHSSCPTCRQCLLGSCGRISGRGGGGEERQQGGAPVQTIITPLQPEGLII